MILRKKCVESMSIEDMQKTIEDIRNLNSSNLMDTTFTRWGELVNTLSNFLYMVEDGDLDDIPRLKKRLTVFSGSICSMIDTMIDTINDRKDKLSEIEKSLEEIKSFAKKYD